MIRGTFLGIAGALGPAGSRHRGAADEGPVVGFRARARPDEAAPLGGAAAARSGHGQAGAVQLGAVITALRAAP